MKRKIKKLVREIEKKGWNVAEGLTREELELLHEHAMGGGPQVGSLDPIKDVPTESASDTLVDPSPEESPEEDEKELVRDVSEQDIVFRGLKVLKILFDELETASDWNCVMENGTTRHVPKNLFE